MNSQIVLDELNRLDVFSGKLNKYVMYLANSLDKDVPLSMRLNISNYALSSFISHFHTKIILGDSLVPTNFIGFTLAQSGSAKTSSVNKLERALGSGYHHIEEKRKEKQEAAAKEKAILNDEDDNWQRYVKKLNPLFNSISTEAGMIKRLNQFKEEGIGMPSLFVDEIATELQCNADIIPNIKLVSELFDVGNKKSKAIKDDSNQSEEVNGMGMCAMFIGSEAGVLLDESVLKKFNTEFLSKLARRCWFNFPDFEFKEKEVSSIDELLSMAEDEEDFKTANSLEIREMASNVAKKLSDNDINNICLSVDAERLYKIYKFHCKYESEKLVEESVMLEQLHRHWKVLKLAGVYAFSDERNQIEPQDIIEAISFSNMISNDLHKFIELSKREVYEVMIDLLRIEEKLSVHDLKKKEIITGTGNPDSKVIGLVTLGNSKLGSEGMLKFEDGYVKLELFKEAEHGASYKLVTGSKEERAYQCKDGYVYKHSSFEKLANLLSNDTSYCAFKYKDGVRSNDNIASGATFVVLDIDDSEIDWHEAHDLLSDLNHHIAKTSDDNNPYKFRVIIELDIEVKLDSRVWKNFMSKVGEYLGINLDLLPMSQMFFGYKNREVLSNMDGEPLPASSLIKNLDEKPKVIKKLPSSKLDEIYEDRFNVFGYAYEAPGETKSSFLYRAMRHMHDIGFSIEQNDAIIRDIVEYHGNDIKYIYKRTSLDRQMERLYERNR